MKNIFLIFTSLLILRCSHNDFQRVDQLIANKEYPEAINELANLPQSVNRTLLNHYYTFLDSVFRSETNEEKKLVTQVRHEHGKGTLSIVHNPEYEVDTSKAREQLCKLWNNYLSKYSDGLLVQSFKKKMLSFGKPCYNVLQDSIAHDFIQSKDIDLLKRGFEFLGNNAFMRQDYEHAKVYFVVLLELTNDPVYSLLAAECNYLQGDIVHARYCANEARQAATGKAKEPYGKFVAHWLTDYSQAEKHPNSYKKQHVFFNYY